MQIGHRKEFQSWRFTRKSFVRAIRSMQFLHLSWRKANARNVSFETLYGGQFTLSTQLIEEPNYLGK